MMKWVIYGMVYLGSALMVYNIVSYLRFSVKLRRETKLEKDANLLNIPIILLGMFLVGYLAVGVFGQPDLIISGILFGGSVFVFLVFYVLIRITERVKENEQVEARLMAAEESNRAKTVFLSSMSHEIRTPMNAIIGLDNLALKEPDLKPHTREQLEKIGASARHLLGLINDILDMSRIESGRMVLKEEEFGFRDLLDQINVIINGQCQDKGLDYECRIIGCAGDYYIGDELKLKQVMINILGNAVKFTEPPGSVTLSVEQVRRYEDFCTLRFVMADTGIGMSKEYIPRIFEAFSQENGDASNRYGSTGLGMAITKNFVELMNGEIHVESEKGVGTTFTVTVMLKASDRSAIGEQDGRLPKNMKALVVDDDAVACEHGQLVLKGIGIEADYAASGEAAIARVRAQGEAGDPYRIVLTDYRMPGMDGIELSKALRAAHGGELSIILLTGYRWEDIQGEAKAAGVDGIMSKPLFADTLVHELRRILDRQPDAQAVAAQPEARAKTLEGRHVLVAEDMEINAEILIDLLDMEGVSADHAENGRIAVDMFAASAPGTYDAVLMDVRMPVMDGLEATRAIRALEREDAGIIPIIALTANAFDEDVRRSLQAGMTAHLSKPVEPERLYETLGKLVRNPER